MPMIARSAGRIRGSPGTASTSTIAPIATTQPGRRNERGRSISSARSASTAGGRGGRVDIRGTIDGLAPGLLGRNVAGRPDDPALGERAGVARECRDAEVEDLPPAGVALEQVLRLEVTVDDAGGGRGVDAFADLGA